MIETVPFHMRQLYMFMEPN